MKIRPIVKSEIETVYQIDKSVFQPMNYPLFVIRQYFDLFPDYFLIAENEKKEIIGYTIGGINNKEKKGWLLSLATKKECRKQGIGFNLTSSLIEIMNKSKIYNINLTVEPNNPAINIYKKLGFIINRKEMNYYGKKSPRIIMEIVKSC